MLVLTVRTEVAGPGKRLTVSDGQGTFGLCQSAPVTACKFYTKSIVSVNQGVYPLVGFMFSVAPT